MATNDLVAEPEALGEFLGTLRRLGLERPVDAPRITAKPAASPPKVHCWGRQRNRTVSLSSTPTRIRTISRITPRRGGQTVHVRHPGGGRRRDLTVRFRHPHDRYLK